VKRLVSDHAEDVGGQIVEPGDVFDETDADEATIERLMSEEKLADAGSAEKSSSKSSKGS
jgi:hypothetical protein